MQYVIMLNVVMMSVIMLNVVMMSGIMLSVTGALVAPPLIAHGQTQAERTKLGPSFQFQAILHLQSCTKQ